MHNQMAEIIQFDNDVAGLIRTPGNKACRACFCHLFFCCAVSPKVRRL